MFQISHILYFFLCPASAAVCIRDIHWYVTHRIFQKDIGLVGRKIGRSAIDGRK